MKKLVALLLALAMVLSLVACGTTDTGKETTPAADPDTEVSSGETSAVETEEKEHFTLRMVRVGNIQDPTQDRILLELQERLNFTLEIISISWDQFPSQLYMMVNAGDPIDLIMCGVGDEFYGWADNDLIYSYEELFEMGDYPLCERVVYADMYSELANPSDGLHYGKAMPTPTNAWGYVIRTDWLEELGLDMPETIEDFYNIVKSFAEADLGSVDCTGLELRAGGTQGDFTGSGVFGYIQRAFNVNYGDFSFKELDDGTLEFTNLNEGAKEATKLIRQMINEGLINYDFSTMPAESDQGRYADDFAAGKVGVAYTSNPTLFMEKLKAADPDADMAFLAPVTSDYNDVPNSGDGTGYWYVHCIPKTCENPARVMEVLEYGLTSEGRELTLFGIEGVHWTDYTEDEDGNRIYTINAEECAKDWDVSANGLRYPMCWGFINYHAELTYIPIEDYEDFDEAYVNSKSWVRDDEANGLPTFVADVSSYSVGSPLYGSQDPRVQFDDYYAMTSIYTEYWLKAVYAKTDEEFETMWDEMVTRTMEGGGQKRLDGGNELWAELNG